MTHMPDLTGIPQEHRDRLAAYVDTAIARWADKTSDQYIRGMRAASLLVREGDHLTGLSMALIEIGPGSPEVDDDP